MPYLRVNTQPTENAHNARSRKSRKLRRNADPPIHMNLQVQLAACNTTIIEGGMR